MSLQSSGLRFSQKVIKALINIEEHWAERDFHDL